MFKVEFGQLDENTSSSKFTGSLDRKEFPVGLPLRKYFLSSKKSSRAACFIEPKRTGWSGGAGKNRHGVSVACRLSG